MRKILLCGVFMSLLCGAAQAQYVGPKTGVVDNNGNQVFTPTNPAPVTTTPSATTQSASYALSASVALNTAQLATGSAFPSTWTHFYVSNPGATDIAVCTQGGTCTCPETAIAATNGITVPAGVVNYPFNGNGTAVDNPTWASCSGTNNVTVAW